MKKSLTVTQQDKSVFTFKVGDIVKLVTNPIGYLTKDEPMLVRWIDKDTINFIDPIKGCGTYERICMLGCMTFEKVA